MHIVLISHFENSLAIYQTFSNIFNTMSYILMPLLSSIGSQLRRGFFSSSLSRLSKLSILVLLVICLHIFNLVSTKLNSLCSDLAITFEVPHAKKQEGDCAFSVAGPHLWNGLPSSVRTVDHMDRFKNKLKSHLFPWFFQAPRAHCKRCYINHIIIIIIFVFIWKINFLWMV